MTREDFEAALLLAGEGRCREGIGRLGEKSVHAVLKYAYEPHPENHEIPLGGYVADILGEDGVIEVQSRDLWKLAPKLRAFLPVCRVTVVCPLAASEWILRTDPDTGETARRKSPKRARPFDILPALSPAPIRELLLHPRLRLRVVMLEVERQDIAKPGACRRQRLDRWPLAFLGEIRLDRPEDYRVLVPEMGPGPFTAAEFGRAAGRPLADARAALLPLIELGLVSRAGKRGKYNLYILSDPKEEFSWNASC